MAKKKTTVKTTRKAGSKPAAAASKKAKVAKKAPAKAKKAPAKAKKAPAKAKKAPAKAKKAPGKVAKKAPGKVAKKAPAKAKKAPVQKKIVKTASSKKAPGKKKVALKASAIKKPAGKKTRRRIDFANPKSVAAVAIATEADAQGYVFINGRRVRSMSTKGMVLKKKTRTTKTVAAAKPAPERDVASIKTKMLKKDLDTFKALLLEKRRTIVGMVSGLENEALKPGGGKSSSMPIHMADVGSDAFEQDLTLGMAETERMLLHEIDGALDRIQNKTYGVCQTTGKAIPRPRLRAKPWAKFTVEAARANERAAAAE